MIIATTLKLISTKYNNKVTKEIELQYLVKYLKLNSDFTKEEDKDEVKNVILGDLSALIAFFTENIPSILIIFFNISIISYRLYSIKPFFVVVSIVLSILPIAINYFLSKPIGRINQASKHFQDRYLTLITQYINGKREILQNGNINFFMSKYANILERGMLIIEKNIKLGNYSSLLLFIVNVGSNLIVFFVLGMMVLSGKITVGYLVSINMLISQLKNILVSLSSIFKSTEIALVSIKRVHDTLQDKVFLNWSFKNAVKTTSIKFKDFSFTYNPDKNIIKSFSKCFVGPGLYLVKGANGCGKTTLLNCIAGIFPQNAEIKGSIQVVSNIKPNMFFQDSSFFSFSIKDNILLGLTSDSYIYLEGDQKILGSDINPSKGQLKYIALRRLVSSNSNILLIDEADANFDSSNILYLKTIVQTLSKNKLVIVVTHSSYFDDIEHKDIYL